jgi:hypothetical protein
MALVKVSSVMNTPDDRECGQPGEGGFRDTDTPDRGGLNSADKGKVVKVGPAPAEPGAEGVSGGVSGSPKAGKTVSQGKVPSSPARK